VTVARALTRRSAPLDVRGLVVGNEIPDGLSRTALSWALVAGVVR
jgi:hypothetical protein